MDADEPDSLAYLLGLTMEEFETVFIKAGFMSRKKTKLVFHSDKFRHFIDEHDLKIEADVCLLNLFGMRDAHVVSVGTPRNSNIDFYHARSQFKTHETQARRPRLRIDRQRHELRCRLDFLLNDDNKEVDNNKNDDEEIQQNNSSTNDNKDVDDEIREVEEKTIAAQTSALVRALLSKIIKPDLLISQECFKEDFNESTIGDVIVETAKRNIKSPRRRTQQATCCGWCSTN